MFRTVFRRLHGRSSDFGIFFNIKLLITGTTKKYNLKRNPRQIVYKRGHQLLAFRIFEFYRALSAISKVTANIGVNIWPDVSVWWLGTEVNQTYFEVGFV